MVMNVTIVLNLHMIDVFRAITLEIRMPWMRI